MPNRISTANIAIDGAARSDHLGNLALRSEGEIRWDSEKERVMGNKKADDMVACPYREPWKLPYSRRRT